MTGQGDHSTADNPIVFGPNEQMTKELMHDEGVNQARQDFLNNGNEQPDYNRDGIEGDPYAHVVNLESYYKGFIFKATTTATYLGSYTVIIQNSGDGIATFTIPNTSGMASVTHIPSTNYQNPSMETIVNNISNNPLSYMPRGLPDSLGDFWHNYLPSGLLNNRVGPGPGGNIYQIYTWTEPIP